MWLFSLSLLCAFAQENADTSSTEQSNLDTENDTSTSETNEEPINSDEVNKSQSPTKKCDDCNSDEDSIKPTSLEDGSDLTETSIPEAESEEIMAIEKMIEEAFSEENIEAAFADGFDTSDEEEDSFNYKGNLYYASQVRYWSSPTKHTIYSIGFSGDPQYWFKQGNWGPTIGLRFKLAASETQQQLLTDHLLGITAGMQFGAFRINTAGSWMWERYFFQYNSQKETDLITYSYDELERMSGVLWEQTLTFAPEHKDLGIQLSVGFPFEIFGKRDLGEPFVDSFKAGALMNFKSLHLGYSYTQYPKQFIHMPEFGFGYLF